MFNILVVKISKQVKIQQNKDINYCKQWEDISIQEASLKDLIPVLMNGMVWIPAFLHLAQSQEPYMELSADQDFPISAIGPWDIPFEQPTGTTDPFNQFLKSVHVHVHTHKRACVKENTYQLVLANIIPLLKDGFAISPICCSESQT